METNSETYSVDEGYFKKNQFYNISAAARPLYEATKALLQGKFQYIFDLAVLEQNKVFIVVIPTAANLDAYRQFLIDSNVVSNSIFIASHPDVTYATKLQFDALYNIFEIEADYVFETASTHINNIAALSTILPNYNVVGSDFFWIEGNGSIGYKANSQYGADRASTYPECTLFHSLYPTLDINRLYYVFEDAIIKFYYLCPYKENHALGTAWFTKIVFSGQDPVLYKYISFFNEKRIENTI